MEQTAVAQRRDGVEVGKIPPPCMVHAFANQAIGRGSTIGVFMCSCTACPVALQEVENLKLRCGSLIYP